MNEQNTFDRQTAKFIATVSQNLPDLDATMMQGWIQNPQALKKVLAGALCPPLQKKPRRKHIIDCDADSFIPDGWKVEEHKKGGQFEWDATKVTLYLDDGQKKNKYIKGEKLREKLVDQPLLNANVLDHLLAHPDLIPEEWKSKDIFFWGTIYSRSGGGPCVRYLRWGGGKWRWDYYWLGHDWGGNDPAAVLASPTNATSS